MPLPKRHFTTPVIVDHDGDLRKDWFVFFRYFTKGKWHVIKKREGVNRIKDRKERKREIEALRTAREKWLEMGWNPILDPDFTAINSLSKHDYGDLKSMNIVEALEFALEKKTIAIKTRYDYRATVKYISQAALNSRLSQLPIIALKRVHVKALMEAARQITGGKKRVWSEKGYNKNLDAFSSLLTDLVEWDVLEFNPALSIARLDEPETEKFIPLTIEEKNIVTAYLKVKNMPFFVYVSAIYSTGIRPKELLGLQITDIDLSKEVIRLQPFSERTKTKKERTVAINGQLLKHFRAMLENKNYPPSWHVFSEGFRPGEKRISRTVATDLWNDLVRGHLGIDKFLYSMKHLGADDLADAAKKNRIKKESIEELVQNNLGHSSRFMTRRYTKKGIQINQDIIRRISPTL